MKIRKTLIMFIAALVLTLSFPLSALAADETPEVVIPDNVTNIVPPPSDISDDPNYGESPSVAGRISMFSLRLASSNNSVDGGCSISKLSSSSVNVSGYSACSSSDPAIKVTLMLQAYYDDSWHTLATKSYSTAGTSVSLSQNYNVTSGYYYRVKSYHSIADGTGKTKYSTSILVG